MSEPPKISIEPGSPPYEQVRQQIAELIESGSLPAGTRLPPVRQLAGDLRLAAGTVARAYAALEAAGLVVTRRGGGTLVAHRPEPSAAQRRAQLADQALSYAQAVRRIGSTDDEALAAVAHALNQVAVRPDRTHPR